MSKIYLYGDSLLKATVPDEQFRYHFHAEELAGEYDSAAEVVNRARMGATIRKGLQMVQRDLSRGEQGQFALVGYGGNDCDFDWQAISDDPAGEHHPHTELPDFCRMLRETVEILRGRGVQPLLMTLPPIDAERYLTFICRRGLNRDRILTWLGDCQMIYRYQELYSNTISDFAVEQKLPLIPVRRAFLDDRKYADMISADGIHMNMSGYRRLFGTIAEWVQAHLA